MSDTSDSEVEFNVPLGAGQGDGAREDHSDKESVDEGDTEEVHKDPVRSFMEGPSPTQEDIPDLEPAPNTRRWRRDINYLGIPHERRDRSTLPSSPRYDQFMSRPIFNSRGPSFKPEAFTGDEDWDSYISHFEVCAELGGWSQRDKALALAASLKGQARVYYMNLAPAERSSYANVVFKLGQRFGNMRQHSLWLARLESHKRQQGESMATLGDDLRRMARRAYPVFDIQAQETLALNQLYRTISPEMKYRCIAAQCRTITEAVQLIETYEGIVGVDEKKKSTMRKVETSKKPKQDNKKSNLQENNSNTDKVLLEQIMQRLDRIEEKQESRRTYAQGRERRFNNQQGRRLCFTCNSPDHLYRDCPLNLEQKQEAQSNNVQGNGNPSLERPQVDGGRKACKYN